MLLSWVLTLQPEEQATVPSNLGRAIHAWFLGRVGAADAELAEEIHSGHGLRPFTASNLWELGRARGPQATVSPEETYTCRVTSFSPALSRVVKEGVLPALPETVTLADAAFQVTGSTTDPAEHGWAGEATFEGLVQRFTLAADVSRSLGLRFASPTAFRRTGGAFRGERVRDYHLVLPLPDLVFGGLLDKWNAFSPIEVHPDVRRFAEACLVVSSHRLRTRRVAFGPDGQRGVVPGFVGYCRYYVEVPDRYWTGLIQLLAGFSLYGGVGLRTTMGLGQARKLRDR
jgi:CRISPR-associated endoribonuclease Cas6